MKETFVNFFLLAMIILSIMMLAISFNRLEKKLKRRIGVLEISLRDCERVPPPYTPLSIEDSAV